jgi:hypothetical protein
MAKIDRYDGNLRAFGSSATGTERTVFGDTSQSDTLDDNVVADFFRGWGITGPTFNPTKQDFNGLGFTLGQLIAYLHQQGIPEWNTSQECYQGSVVTTLAGIYRLKNGGDATVDPDNDNGTNWELAPTRAEVDAKANQSTTYTETEVDALIRPVVGEVKLFAGNSSALNTMYVRGWRIADGTDGTPNLTDAFPKFGTFAQKLGAGGSKDITATVANHTLSTGQIPAHKHDLLVYQGELEDSGSYIRSNDQGPGRIANEISRGSTGGSLPHSHGLNGATGANEPQFTYLVPLYFTGVAGTYS